MKKEEQFIYSYPHHRKLHGLAGTRFYKTYYDMKHRCENPTDKRYHVYGGKGVRVVWESFNDFKIDMYESWLIHASVHGEKRTQIDRIDVDGNYCKENCRWATPKLQQRNRSNNNLITFQGKTKTAVEWGEITGITGHEVRKRLYRGWSIERTLTQPNLGVGKYIRK